MSTISVRSEAAGCALGNEQARPANEDEKEPQFDAVRQADSLKALKVKQLFWKSVFLQRHNKVPDSSAVACLNTISRSSTCNLLQPEN
jgi:hypothetical protein